jgi:hypothetical protein
VALTLEPDELDELLELLPPLLPHAATPSTSAPVTGSTASHLRDFTGSPSFAFVVAATLAFPAEESVTGVWRECEKDVNGQ